jgi:hypothetical protein
VVGRLGGVVEIDGAPFDVEDSIGRTPGHRRENAAGPAWEARAARVYIRALVVKVWEDAVVVGEPRQANVSEGGICSRELGIAVGRQIDARVRVAIERVSEGERDGGYQIIRVIADVRRPRHDIAPYLRYGVMVLRRATRYCVIP